LKLISIQVLVFKFTLAVGGTLDGGGEACKVVCSLVKIAIVEVVLILKEGLSPTSIGFILILRGRPTEGMVTAKSTDNLSLLSAQVFRA
jgi:hypothetical protein